MAEQAERYFVEDEEFEVYEEALDYAEEVLDEEGDEDTDPADLVEVVED